LRRGAVDGEESRKTSRNKICMTQLRSANRSVKLRRKMGKIDATVRLESLQMRYKRALQEKKRRREVRGALLTWRRCTAKQDRGRGDCRGKKNKKAGNRGGKATYLQGRKFA